VVGARYVSPPRPHVRMISAADELTAGQGATSSVDTRGNVYGSDAFARSMFSYFQAFAPVPEWDEIVCWPPDVFALANLVLDHTEGYRFVVAPPRGRSWPPLRDWNDRVLAAADAWRRGDDPWRCKPSPLVRKCWQSVTAGRDTPLALVRSGEAWDLVAALLTLHAIADEASSEVLGRGRHDPCSFEGCAWASLQQRGSLARLSPTRVRIVPKTHSSAHGITIRSLSRYLALCYESVEVRWRSVELVPSADLQTYDVVLLPWPLSVSAGDFRPASPLLLKNMDLAHFGFFEFAPSPPLDCALVDRLLEEAVSVGGKVDAMLFPETAIRPDVIPMLEETLDKHGVSFLIAGVRQPPMRTALGRNYVHFGLRTGSEWKRYEQDKHHRWCLDSRQIRQYHLTRSLRPTTNWWEAIDICERTLHVVDVGGGVTVAPLVCEDLARLDEVADLVRRIGPGLVVALLQDGPQLTSRWPARYASVIADDPGSAVLTLTSLGMATRSTPPGKRCSRVVAHWNSRSDGVHEIALAPGAAGVLLSTAIDDVTLWTADGRRHGRVPQLTLSSVRSLRAA